MAAKRDHRNYKAMRDLRKQGLTLLQVAKAMGCSESRVVQILGPNSGARDRIGPPRRTTVEQDNEMLALYQAGLILKEIGERYGLSAVTVRSRICDMPGYRPRHHRNVRPQSSDIEVPDWVPSDLHDRYVHLTRFQNEHIAASCVRKAKRLGVSA